ncbi:hypothetical protein FX988_04138 [Paraglaciecola mesophila]|uniref:Uncharacterized protein n=1 Tax=Paraglaciecola mesophila TaxID=197222 RepID=A0A857JSD8_9ALTE|nr:hypothetical protein [Paraglaciecola mesophila]QHJ13857.1 hypothetical protein FX988_04138 [Paraglaciecola mesophila]
MKRILAFLSTLIATPPVFADSALLCTDCSDPNKAKAFATSMASRLICDQDVDPDISCSSRNKIVTLVDRDSGKAYQYNVYHEPDAPWNVNAERIVLSDTIEEGFEVLTKFYRDLNAAITSSSSNISRLSGSINNVNNTSSTFAQAKMTNCPAQTALSTITDASAMQNVEDVARLEIATNLSSKNKNTHLNPIKKNNTYSLNFMGIGLTIIDKANSRPPSFVVTFDESERSTSLQDYLLFTVDVLGYDANNIPITDFNLSDNSRVAGFTLSRLRGENGPVPIDNECVETRLEEAVNMGLLTVKTSSVGGSGGAGGGADSGGEGSGASFPVSGGMGCQIADFFQSGEHIYTFKICS